MIIPIMPVLSNVRDTEEVRKALQNIALQLNNEINDIRDRVKALETP